MAAATLLYLTSMGYRMKAFLDALRARPRSTSTTQKPEPSPTPTCRSTRCSCPPTASRRSSPDLIDAIDALDYPRRQARREAAARGGRRRDDRRGRRALEARPHRDRARAARASRGRSRRRCNYGLTLARGEFVDDLRRRGPARARCSSAGRSSRFAGRPDERRLPAGQARLLQRRPEPASPAGSRPSTRCGSRCSCPGLVARARRSRSAARRTTSAATCSSELGALGPVQRDRGRRPRHPAAPAGYRTAVLDSTTSRRPTATSSTGSSSGRAGTRATCRPGSCTCATRGGCIGSSGSAASCSFNLFVGGTPLLALAQPDLLG